ncbi:MAG: DUF2530 domain-containing protein [Mycobacterium sp.]
MPPERLAPPPAPPALPTALLDPRPVVGGGVVLWALAAIAAFTVSGLDSWRPITLGGLGVGLFGAGLFLWQRSAARRGARGAQTGLEPHRDSSSSSSSSSSST